MVDGAMGEVANSSESELSPRQAALWGFLKREKVGDSELLFTANHARQFMQESDVKVDTMVWDLLRRLEEKRFLKRKKGKRGEGITLLFDAKGPSRNSSQPHAKPGRRTKKAGRGSKVVTGKQALAKIDGDIAAIEEKLNNLKADLSAKRALRKQVIELFGGE